MQALIAAAAILTACSAGPAPDACGAAAGQWAACTGQVPEGFEEACAADSALADQIVATGCDGLVALGEAGKADGAGSLFRDWKGPPVQPRNFDKVSDGVYRGQNLLIGAKVRYLKELGVKTILDLEIYNPEQLWEEALIDWNDMDFVSKGMLPNKIYDAAFIDDIVAVLADPAVRPVYVHCYFGYDRTGLIVALHEVVNEGVDPVEAFHHWKAHMPGAGRCGNFPELDAMFNRKVRELGYDFQIDPDHCASQ